MMTYLHLSAVFDFFSTGLWKRTQPLLQTVRVLVIQTLINGMLGTDGGVESHTFNFIRNGFESQISKGLHRPSTRLTFWSRVPLILEYNTVQSASMCDRDDGV